VKSRVLPHPFSFFPPSPRPTKNAHVSKGQPALPPQLRLRRCTPPLFSRRIHSSGVSLTSREASSSATFFSFPFSPKATCSCFLLIGTGSFFFAPVMPDRPPLLLCGCGSFFPLSPRLAAAAIKMMFLPPFSLFFPFFRRELASWSVPVLS